MNSLDYMLSFVPEVSAKNTISHSRPCEFGMTEIKRPLNRDGDRQDGLSFTQILHDRAERAEQAMTTKHRDRMTTSGADGATNERNDHTPFDNQLDSESTVNSSERAASAASEASALSDLSDRGLAIKPLPAIIAQNLAVQAQVTFFAGETAQPVAELSNGAQVSLAVETMLASISETAHLPAPSDSSDQSTTEAAKDSPTLTKQMPNGSVNGAGSQQHLGDVLNPEKAATSSAAASLKEIESVIQALIDEDAELELESDSGESDSKNLGLNQRTQLRSLGLTQADLYTPKAVVSESQMIGDAKVSSEVSTAESGATSDNASGNASQQEADFQQPLQSNASVANPTASDENNQGIALENVETVAPSQDPQLRAPMNSADQSVPDLTVARQIRQQVIHHVASRISNVMVQEKLVINLNPESLGQVEVTFEPQGDRLMVLIVASDRMAEAALRDEIKELTERITERSGRFNQVEIKVEIKDGAEARQEGKENDKHQERQDQKREQQERDKENKGSAGFIQAESLETRQAWQSALAWQLNQEPDELTVSEEK